MAVRPIAPTHRGNMHDIGCEEVAELAESLQPLCLLGEELIGWWHCKGLHEHPCAGAACGETGHCSHSLDRRVDRNDVINPHGIEPLQQ